MRALNTAGAHFKPRTAHRSYSTGFSTGNAAGDTTGFGETPDVGALPAAIRRAAMELFDLATRLENEGARPAPDVSSRPGVVPVTVDVDGFRAWVGADPVSLTHQEFRLLQELVAHSGRVRTREQLAHEAWNRERAGSSRTVDVHVRRLRVALGPAAARVSTVRNVGYRFD